MIDLKLVVETVQKVRNAKDMAEASAPVIAILEGQLACEQQLKEDRSRLEAEKAALQAKYSDLLQSHHGLCGKIEELKAKVAS
jgi:hypothetical protein